MTQQWRFYVGSDSKWHWQKLSSDGTVVERCAMGQLNYRRCVLDAKKHGYKVPAGVADALDRSGTHFSRWNL